MFPNESSSDVLTSKTNAFVQTFKEVQQINPTDQVPDLRDTIDCRADNAMKTAPSTLSPPASHTGCEPCALCRVGGEGGRAGPLLSLPLVPPMSVISSSTLEEPLPPSVTTVCGAPQSSKPSSHQQYCGSSSSNSAQTLSAEAWPVNGALLSCKSSSSRSQTPEHIPACAALYKARWGIAHFLRLCGGGETATATSGWNNNNTNNATAPYGQSNSTSGPTSQPPAAQWNNNNGNGAPQRPATNSSPQQPPATGNAGLKPNNNATGINPAPPAPQPQGTQPTQPPSQPTTNTQPPTANGTAAPAAAAAQNGNNGTWAQAAGKGLPPTAQAPPTATPPSASTKQQLEQLNNMREALFSQDGWGAHVNQDSGWDIPSSPEPGQKDSTGAPLPPVWKPNVNNGTDLWEANLRNGGQPPPRVEKTTPWGHTPANNIGGTWGVDDDVGDNVWNPQSQWPSGPNQQPQPPLWTGGGGGPKKEPEWAGGNGSQWGDPRDPRDMRGAVGGALDPREMARNADMRSNMVDQRDPMRNVMDQQHSRGMVGGDVMMRGDPRGISGRLNGGASEGMWPQQPPPHHLPPAAKPAPWPGGPPSKDKPNGGWEEPSPPQQRRNIPNYDDGTSLWGTQQQRLNPAAMQAAAGPNKVSHWKDLPPAGMGRGMPPGMPTNRMPNDIKPNNPLWPHPARNGSWEGPHEVPSGGAAPWTEVDKVGGVTSWNDPSLLAGPKYKMGWDGDVNAMNPNWDHPPKQPQKPVNKDLIWASKQFRILSDMGYKKEEVETALRNSNMSLEDALELLNMSGAGGNWRGRHADMEPPFDHSSHPGFPGSQPFNRQQLPFAPPGSSGNGPAASSQALGNMSPAIVQKIMTQQPPPQQAPSQPPTPFTQARAQQPNQPSAHQLRMLVQQIQMAVQAGYLNHQILNQPLAPQTLILLNQLLQHIKVLQSLHQQQQMLQIQNPLAKPNSNQAMLHNAVQITKTKQQISNLQNQIQAQQAVYVKQQQHQMAPQQGDFFKSGGVHDPLSALPSNFSDLTINKEAQQSSFQSQQSRLTQWKLPSLDKDGDLAGSEFSRAPGSTTKPSGGNTSPNLNPLLGQADGTWSRSNSEGGWPDSGSVPGDEAKDWPNTTQANNQAFTDLVPEFEPGKPWKGTQMKSIEDDPSITPGSVVRSPLSLATIKDTEIFSSGGKTSPTNAGSDMPIPPLSLSNSTWSFNPPASTASSSFTSPLGKLSGSKSTWGEAGPGGNELWGAPNKARGPPPGLSSKAPASNGWGSQGRWGPQQTPNTWPNSTWLLLRNLTPQIDGSTLKTLCVQHGPLQNFHLYLNHGIALAKYSTRDEANKAQGALNNCVLSNTTIFAEMLGENDVQSLLQHLGQQSGSGGPGGWGRGGGKDTWGTNTGWPPAAGGSSLWGPDPAPDPHRSTPSSLNSFLPGDLLGPPNDSM